MPDQTYGQCGQCKSLHTQCDEVVISGLSGRLPESDNIAEFRENLFKGIDMVTDDNRRWEPGFLMSRFFCG